MKALHRFQLRTLDLFILTGVVALEVASFARASIVLFSLFVTVSIITVAVVRQRALLRNLLVIAIVGVWVSVMVAVEIARVAQASSGASGGLQVGSQLPRRTFRE